MSRAAGKQLARFTGNIVETASVTASIDNAWSSGRSGAVVFHGRLIDADSRSSAECFCVAQAGRDLVPVALTRANRTPPGDIAPTTSFIGSGRLSRPAWRSRIFVIAKDAEGDFAVIARRPLIVDETGLFETALDLIVPALHHHQDAEHQTPGNQQICTLLGDMFPFEIDIPPIQSPAQPRPGQTRTCHFVPGDRFDTSGTEVDFGELIGKRFDRIVVTCMTDRPRPVLDNVQRAVEFDRPDIEVSGGLPSTMLWRSRSRQSQTTWSSSAIRDILQFDLSEGAIDKAIRRTDTGMYLSIGYLHDGVTQECRSEKSFPDRCRAMTHERSMLTHASGFAAVMPAAHFQLGARRPAPALFHPANQVKALLLELEQAGMTELRLSPARNSSQPSSAGPQSFAWNLRCSTGSTSAGLAPAADR